MIAERIAFLPYQERLTIQPEGRMREVPVQMKGLSPPRPQESHWHQEIRGNRYLLQASRRRTLVARSRAECLIDL
jgi:hypothetical protein